MIRVKLGYVVARKKYSPRITMSLCDDSNKTLKRIVITVVKFHDADGKTMSRFKCYNEDLSSEPGLTEKEEVNLSEFINDDRLTEETKRDLLQHAFGAVCADAISAGWSKIYTTFDKSKYKGSDMIAAFPSWLSRYSYGRYSTAIHKFLDSTYEYVKVGVEN